MIIYLKSGERVQVAIEGAALLTKENKRGTLQVEIRDKDGNFIGLVQDPQAILP